jgi:hypothetical protein
MTTLPSILHGVLLGASSLLTLVMIEHGFQIHLLLMQSLARNNDSDLFFTYSNCKLGLPGGKHNSV